MFESKYRKYMNNFVNFFINIDSFGVIYSPRFFGKHKIKSGYGALLTILLILLGLVKIFQIVDKISSKKDFSVLKEKHINSNKEINLKNLKISFCVESVYEDIFDHLVFEPFVDSLLGLSSEIDTIKIKLGGIHSYSCYRYNLSKLFLEDSENLFLVKTLGTYIFSKKYPLPLRLTVIFDEIYIDDTNYYKPISIKRHMMETQQITLYNYNLDCNVDEISVEYSNNYNIIFYKSTKLEEKIYSTITECKLSPSTAPYQGSLYVTFKLSGWKYKYIFIGYNFEKLISEFGGYFQTLRLIFGTLASFINKIIRRKMLLNNFKKKMIYFRQFKGDEKENINLKPNKKIFEIDLILLKKINNSMNENNKRITSNKQEKKINILENLNKVSLVHSNSDNYFLHERIMGDCSLNKKRTKKIDHENILSYIDRLKLNEINGSIFLKRKKHNYKEINQFINIFDCYSIYQLYKDVKILEFLCLNSKNAETYYKFRKISLNLNKFEKSINRIILEDEENEYFDNLEQKIRIIYNSIIKY